MVAVVVVVVLVVIVVLLLVKLVNSRSQSCPDLFHSPPEIVTCGCLYRTSRVSPYFSARAREDLNPIKVRDLLASIPSSDLPLLWSDEQRGRPEDLILTHLFVPPVAIRPSVPLDTGGGTNEDDLTIKLQVGTGTRSLLWEVVFALPHPSLFNSHSLLTDCRKSWR